MNMPGRNGTLARVRNACACGLVMCLPTIFSGNSYALGCDGGGFVTVTASVSSIAESGGGTAQFIFAVTALAGADAHLTLQITGAATNGVDYQTLPTQVTLPANQSQVTLTLRPIPDGVPEGTEGVTVAIAASDNICVLVGFPNAATISIVDPTGPPGPPTGVTATAGNAQASLSFTPPINDGGSAITGYNVTSNPAGGIDSDAGTTTTTRTISALTNGTSYTFTVTASNGIATSVPSAPSNSVIPATTPSAPLAVTAMAGNALATVSFAAPASDGGSAITGFTVTSSPAGGVDSKAGTTAMMHTITGLTIGTPYTFTVIATNAIGQGTPSAASNIVTPDVGLPPIPTGIVTRKVHGAAGTFDLPLTLAPPVNHNPTTEPRLGPAQTIVFTFDKAISAATVNISEGTATAGAPTFSGSDVIVGLTGVINQQYVAVALTNVASTDGGTGGSSSVRVGFLAGDVNQSRVVSIADLGLVNAQLAQVVTAANFLKDVNASGTLTLADKGITNANLTKALAPP